MRVRKAAVTVGILGILALSPSHARADWLIAPFIGANFGGDTVRSKPNFGASFSYMVGSAAIVFRF